MSVVTVWLRASMSIAEFTSVVSALLPIAELKDLCEYASKTTHAKTRLSMGGCSVISVTHNGFVAVAVKLRLTRSLVVAMFAMFRRAISAEEDHVGRVRP